MENCLVTKMKGIVNNKNLSKIGEISVVVNSNFQLVTEVAIEVRANKNAISLVEGGSYTESVNIPAGTTSSTTVYVSQECTVFIPQWNLRALIITPIKDTNISYIGIKSNDSITFSVRDDNSLVNLGTVSTKTNYITIRNCTCDFNKESYPSLKSFSSSSFNKSQIINISELVSKAPLLESFSCYTSANNLIGVLSDFGVAKNIATLTGLACGGGM